jgi:hypothetical protein
MNVHQDNYTMHQETISDILVFKTNILHPSDVEKMSSVLDAFPGIRQWNVDRDDIDHVLRIEADDVHPSQIISIVKKAGYKCEELPD